MTNIAILGTASDVGKSIVATALCRIFSNAGIDVAPYKAQNMSNNSGVTPDGFEMGRAQIVQAIAARVTPHADMNPVLLKPNTDTGAQVVLQGKVCADKSAREYFGDTRRWAEAAFESLDRLAAKHELLVIEGAGSCAEMNLYKRDFVNFKTARRTGAAVILVADIDRGGVFAQVAGTLAVIPPEDRELVKGVIINRFRGDKSLFDEGVRMLESMTGVPVLGVLPWVKALAIDAEDAVPLSSVVDPKHELAAGKIGIAAIYFPHISNFTDLAPLERDPSVELHYLHRPKSLDSYKALILPGSKNVRGDLDWLETMGWRDEIEKFRKRGGIIVGLCGGYQMLGGSIADPHGVEGAPGESAGLGLLPITTVLEREKVLCNSLGTLAGTSCAVSGYEIHMGRTEIEPGASPLIAVTERNGVASEEFDGVRSADGRVMGSYFHGFFDRPEVRTWFLCLLDSGYEPPVGAFAADPFELLASHFSENLDLEKLFAIAGLSVREENKS
ncbi:MAG TPA: cobyric acid synthase [Chlorobaculum parvum]|uniref:Cobyric acid synthase n=1 Tax=Chlorobaculum parvum TaxID=274539 RepID=A0A7C5HT08_9CHLB|nr:cobyric acid synthase [Chlorobaculum parvum]